MKNIIKNTPLEHCYRLSTKYNCNIFLKREDLQSVRSFKIRGAYNKIIKNYNNTTEFVTASAGNHAQGVAYTCNKLNLKCNIFIPENTPLQKISRIRYFGDNNCNLVIKGNDFNEALNLSYEYCDDKSKIFVHPYDDIDVIKGQGTIATEILKELNPDIIMASVGGGGLISGLITKLNNYKQSSKNSVSVGTNVLDCDIYGVEPEGAASMYESIKNNKIVKLDNIDTFVDGASVKKVGKLTFEIAKKANGIFKISNDELCNEMVNLYQNEGIITEPAGALSICGLSQLDKDYIKDKNVVCIVSGGNNDLMRYPEIVENSLRYQKLKHYFIIKFKQIPGQLRTYVRKVLTCNSDITRFEYIKKNNRDSGSVLIGIELNKPEEIEIIKQNMLNHDFDFIKLSDNDLMYNYLI